MEMENFTKTPSLSMTENLKMKNIMGKENIISKKEYMKEISTTVYVLDSVLINGLIKKNIT